MAYIPHRWAREEKSVSRLKAEDKYEGVWGDDLLPYKVKWSSSSSVTLFLFQFPFKEYSKYLNTGNQFFDNIF